MTYDHLITAIAETQHGLITTSQLKAIGMTTASIAYRVRVGRLFLVRPHLYAVGTARMTYERQWLAAALTFGDDAVLCSNSAAEGVEHLARAT